MAPTYKLTYFDLTGRGEFIRFLFHYGGIPFVDERVEVDFAKWPSRKHKYPFKALPILEINGKTYYQSRAIGHYLAKQVKLTGRDDLENLEIEQTIDVVNDLFDKNAAYFYEPDQKLKEEKKKMHLKEVLPFYLGKLEEQVKNNNEYLVGGHLTWADLHFACSIEYIKYLTGNRDILADSPNLKALIERVHALPGIKEYISKRPNVP